MRAFLLGALLLAACDLGVGPGNGDGAAMQVTGGTFFAGPPPAANPNGVTITSITSPSDNVHPGEVTKNVGGTAQGNARMISLFYDGDDGYWLVPVGLPDASQPDDLDFSATLAFARTIDDGMHDVELQATGPDGSFGPSTPYTVSVMPLTVTSSTLDVQLTWDSESDVDLHVTEPDGVTIWARNINSYTPPPPGSTAPPGNPMDYGMLDFDSNANCIIDGRREENVYWLVPPPSGHYVVRVDTWSLCGQPAANWHVVATMNGQILGQASGEAIDSDTTFAKSPTSGVLAFQFDVP